jgi:hypothetical protein
MPFDKNSIHKGTKKEAALFGAASRKMRLSYLFNNSSNVMLT